MKPDQYNSLVAESIKAIRLINRKTQKEMAFILSMTQCNYSKIEKGEKYISVALLFRIAEQLNTNIYQILIFADAKNGIVPCPSSLSAMLIKFIKLSEEKIDPSELEKLILLIKSTFEIRMRTYPAESIFLTNYSKME